MKNKSQYVIINKKKDEDKPESESAKTLLGTVVTSVLIGGVICGLIFGGLLALISFM